MEQRARVRESAYAKKGEGVQDVQQSIPSLVASSRTALRGGFS